MPPEPLRWRSKRLMTAGAALVLLAYMATGEASSPYVFPVTTRQYNEIPYPSLHAVAIPKAVLNSVRCVHDFPRPPASAGADRPQMQSTCRRDRNATPSFKAPMPCSSARRKTGRIRLWLEGPEVGQVPAVVVEIISV